MEPLKNLTKKGLVETVWRLKGEGHSDVKIAWVVCATEELVKDILLYDRMSSYYKPPRSVYEAAHMSLCYSTMTRAQKAWFMMARGRSIKDVCEATRYGKEYLTNILRGKNSREVDVSLVVKARAIGYAKRQGIVFREGEGI